MKLQYKITLICALLFSTLSYAQSTYKPTDKWPYVFEKFSPTVIHHTAGKGISNVEANICVDDGTLHYIEDGVILQTTTSTIERVEIGGKTFISVNNYLMEILSETAEGMIVKELKVKAENPGAVDIGFGISSSTNAATNLDLTSTLAFGTSLLHTKIAEAAIEAEYGTSLSLESRINFFINGYLIPATKKDFTDAVGKDAANAFLKANKIKWNDPSTMTPAIAVLKEKQ